jgi:gliding motility-associated-like protein
VPTGVDCDDNDPSVTTTSTADGDCDGVPTGEDCDDNDALNTNSNVNDADCDGVPTSIDCDDNDPSVTTTNTGDGDCDGVLTGDDCDDNDATITLIIGSACNDNNPCTIDDVIDENCDCNGTPLDCTTGDITTELCNDGDPTTVNDIQTILDCDGSICVPCMGTPCQVSVDLGPDLTLSIGDSVQLSLFTNTLVDSVAWRNDLGLSCLDCPEPFVKPTETTTYSVVVTDENGCQASARINVLVDEKRKIYIPSAFSPNGDGINDVFTVEGRSDMRVLSLRVFDRWGGELFGGGDTVFGGRDHSWDGRFRDEDVEVGVYIYVVEVTFTDGSVETRAGELLLIR